MTNRIDSKIRDKLEAIRNDIETSVYKDKQLRMIKER